MRSQREKGVYMKSCCSIALLVLASFMPLRAAEQPSVLTDGTPVRVRLNRNVSSADAKVGDSVDFGVVEDVLVNGAVIIRRGSTVLATVTEAQPKGLMGKSGKLNIALDYVRSILGEKIALRAVKENQRDESSGSVGAIATTIITAPLLPFMKGKDVTIPKGTEVTAYVHGDVRLDETRIRAQGPNVSTPADTAGATPSAPGSATPSSPTPPVSPDTAKASSPAPVSGMTNADVVALKAAGFSDDLMISKIKSSRTAFRMDTRDMIDLKTAGLSDRVIAAMLEKTK